MCIAHGKAPQPKPCQVLLILVHRPYSCSPEMDVSEVFLLLEEEYREGASTAASLDHHLTEMFKT